MFARAENVTTLDGFKLQLLGAKGQQLPSPWERNRFE
jgi:hypothetical protein